MAKTTQEKLLDSFAEAAGSGAAGSMSAVAATQDFTVFAETATESNGAAARSTATEKLSSAKTTGGGGISAASIAKTVLESGLGIIPLIGGLIGLFDGGSNSPPPLTKYVMPPSLDFQAADSGGALTSVSYGQMGNPRAADASSASASSAAGASGQMAPAPAQTTASSQTIDARWFMDHSSEIAAAVRNAMLNLNSINDVVNDL